MISVILQPAGGVESARHYADTIARNVPIAAISRFASQQDVAILRDFYPAGAAPTWGVTRGTRSVNVNKWKRMARGDVVLFSGDRRVFASGVVAHKFHDVELAEHLWGRDPDGNRWEFLYFLTEMIDRDIPQERINTICGYSQGNVVRGFTVLDE